MSTSSVHIVIDRQANAACIRLLDAPVDRTAAVTDEVNVDVDESGRAVGVEVLSLHASIPFEDLARGYGVGSEVAAQWALAGAAPQ